MRERTLFSVAMPYREALDVKGFSFGEGDPAVCVVGALRGNEVQQLYICSQLVRKLRSLEEKGSIVPGREILVIPCANHISMNVGRRFWPVDDTDVNRMFPGYDKGETTQRIAAGLFEAVKGYEAGIQFPSFYLQGQFEPHVRAMKVAGPDTSAADAFGLPYVVARDPEPFDTTTLNYNWRLWGTDAYSLYTERTDLIDERSADVALRASLRFMAAKGAIDYPCHQGFRSSHFDEADLVLAHTTHGGIFRRDACPGDIVSDGAVIARVLSPLTGDVVEEVRAPSGGVVFFACKTPLVTEHTVAFQILPRGADRSRAAAEAALEA